MPDSSDDVDRLSKRSDNTTDNRKIVYREGEQPWVPSSSKQPFLDQRTRLWIKKRRTLLASASASACGTLLTFPLDTIKNRLQAFPNTKGWQCATSIYQKEGVRSFWRGTLTPLVSISTVRTLSMSIYQITKYRFDAAIYQATGFSPLAHANAQSAWPSLTTFACFATAGATAGAGVTAIACPFELTKFSSQVAAEAAKTAPKQTSYEATNLSGARPNQAPLAGFLGTVRWVVKNHGVSGLYSGFRLHLIRDTIGSAVYFSTYETAKQLLGNARGNSPTATGPVFVAGALCGLVSFATVYPIDSAKSIYQRNVLFAKPDADAKPKMPTIQFFNARMYRGLGTSTLRTALLNAIFFSIFERVKKQINSLEVNADDELAQ